MSDQAALLLSIPAMGLWTLLVYLVVIADRPRGLANYNHLFEQPTVFYAITLVIAAAGLADGVFISLAWAFVAIRMGHSAVQMTVNIVPLRFTIFMLGWLVLALMIGRALSSLAG